MLLWESNDIHPAQADFELPLVFGALGQPFLSAKQGPDTALICLQKSLFWTITGKARADERGAKRARTRRFSGHFAPFFKS
jgi:hypothetical protein